MSMRRRHEPGPPSSGAGSLPVSRDAPVAALDPAASARSRLARYGLLLVLAALATLLVLADTDPDLWGRMAYARDHEATGGLAPRADPYSYTAPGAPWIDHEWGFNWVVWLTYYAVGWPGLRALRVLLFASVAALCLHEGAGREAGPFLRPLNGLLIGAPLGLGFLGPRPQAFTFAFTAWLLFCFRRSWERGPIWVLLGVAPMPLWLNLHGGFLAGLGIAGLWGTARLVLALRAGERATARALVAAGAWCLACLPLSPWGLKFLPFIIRTSTMSRPFVEEWHPPGLLDPHWFMTGALVILAALRLFRGPRRWPDLILLVGLALLAFSHRRHLPFLALAVALSTDARRGKPPADRVLSREPGPDRLISRKPDPDHILGRKPDTPHVPASEPDPDYTHSGGPDPDRVHGSRSDLQRVLGPGPGAAYAFTLRALGLLVGGTAVAVSVFAVVQLFRPAPAEPAFPERAVAFMRSRPLSGGTLVDFEWSQYLLFQAWPQFRVAFDGRYEEVYPNDVASRYFAWHYGLKGWRSLPDDPATRLALVRAGTQREKVLSRLPGWHREYADGVATLFVKE